MNRLRNIANPVAVLALICASIYIYFFYQRTAPPLFSPAPPATTEREWERNWENVPPRDPNIVALAGTVDQPQSPINPQDSQNVIPRLNPLEAPQPNPDPVPPALPTQNPPPQPIAVPADMMLIEGHWIGLEVIPLTAAIAQANSIPADVTGALVDEVTLLSAEAGIYAGDVITAVNGKRVTDLKSFRLATVDAAQSNRADVSVYSGGKYKNVAVVGTEFLGVAQMEGAPMILPTSKSPHGYYGPCDRCHAIAKPGPSPVMTKNALNPNELLKDQGDSLKKVAPNIRAGTPPPHRNRGTCIKCHIVL